MEDPSYEDIFLEKNEKLIELACKLPENSCIILHFYFLSKSENNNAINKKSNKKQELKSLWTQTWKNESALKKWKHSS